MPSNSHIAQTETAEDVICWIGLGSNLSDPKAQLLQAFDELAALPDSQLLQRSALWSSAPVGPQDQPDFVNAVAALQTQLPPLRLLDALQAIEQAHRRIRLRHWGPRTLDLDLLLYGDQIINHPRLQVPHPEMHRRGFVLAPLYSVAPTLIIPEKGPIIELLSHIPQDDLRPL